MPALFDDEGFLIDSETWTEAVARDIAEKQFDMKLTETHWTCIRSVRTYYEKWSTLPMVKTIRDEAGLTADQFEQLFKRGTSNARGVLCKISGLPRNLCIAAGC